MDTNLNTSPEDELTYENEEGLYEFCKTSGTVLYVDDGQLEVMGWDQTENTRSARLRSLLQKLPGLDLTVPEDLVEASFDRPTIRVSPGLLDELQRQLEDSDSTIRRLSSWPIDRTFIYLDISDFSQFNPKQQLLVVNSLIGIVSSAFDRSPAMYEDYRRSFEAQLCIGDGYIYVFKSPRWGAFIAAKIAASIEAAIAYGKIPVPFHFRMGVHVGPVLCFWDPGRDNWNYIGSGINGGARVLEAIGKDLDDVVYISDAVRKRLRKSENMSGEPEGKILKNLLNRGRRPDKHGNPWRVYEMNHTAIDAR